MLNKFLGGFFRARRQQVTTQQLSTILVMGAAKMAFMGDNPLAERIRSIDPDIDDTFAFRVETFTFCLLPFDIIATTEFATAQPTLRSAMLQSACVLLQSMIENPDVAGVDWDEVTQLIDHRLLSYGAAIGPHFTEESGRQLSSKAYRHISGLDSVDFRVTLWLQIHFTGAMKHMPEALSNYEIAD